MRTAKETRARAWQTLREGDTYGAFLLALLLLAAVALIVVVPALILFAGFVVTAAALATNGGQGLGAECTRDAMALLEGLGERLGELQPGLIAGAVVVSTALTLLFFYMVGFATWSKCAMSMAAARGGLKTTHALSGWGNGWRMAKLVLWRDFFVFLRLLLLVVPGVIAFYSYVMAPFLQVDHPDWPPRRCLAESERLMEGNRMRFFVLCLSFIGWYLLAMLVHLLVHVGGIAQFFLEPYPSTAVAHFYEELLDNDPEQPHAETAPEPEAPQDDSREPEQV